MHGSPTAETQPVVRSAPPCGQKRKPKVLDMFAGAGGTGLGFKTAGYEIVGVVEKNDFATLTYHENLGVPVTPTDIEDLEPGTYREKLGLAPKELDVLVGCAPCQGFTRMRNKEGDGDDRNRLVLLFLKFVEEFTPRFILFENVPGIINTKHGRKVYVKFLDGLQDLGYNALEELVDAVHYGVPQHRKRVLVVAGRDGEQPPFPAPTHGDPNLPAVREGRLQPWVTVKDAIDGKRYPYLLAGEDGRQIPTGGGEKDARFPNHVAADTGQKVLDFLAKVPWNGGSRKDVSRRYWLPCHKKVRPNGREHEGHCDVYGRLHWDKPSVTLTTSCTNPSKGRFTHPNQLRSISYREAATLQGFPYDFVFHGSSISVQIGNAVPPPLAEAVALALKAALSKPAPAPTQVPVPLRTHVSQYRKNAQMRLCLESAS